MAYQSATESAAVVRPPSHPVPRLQAPFEESMAESVIDDTDADIFLDPVARRNHLLEAPLYTRAVAGRWKQKPGEKYHPLWKLIAQISFGIHLLAEGLARSEDEVMQILQSHVDEIDGFLERTTEDFDLAQEDIQERLRCLKLPLSHPATFDKMLEDRNFRLSIVNGNEKIEHIVERTSQAMKDSLKDVQKGFDSTSCLETYLKELAQTWVRQSIEHEAVFVAMQGNVEGWRKAFMSLHIQGSHLGGSLKKLTDIINEMQKRAGEISRRLLHQARGYSPSPDARPQQQHRLTSTGRSTPTSRFAPNKDLPRMPNRPSLQAAGSHDSVRTDLSARTSSSDTLAHLSQLSRSTTPQYELPVTRNVNINPMVTQEGQSESGRVQSMTPSVSDSRSSVQSTSTTIKSRSTDDEEPPERYFPPVELPAHVPEETMSKAPISKQNRLSIVLNPALVNGGEKPPSKTPGLTLIGLLKSNHILSKSSATSKNLTPTSPNEKLQTQRAAKSSEVISERDSTSDKTESVSVSNGTKPTARSATITRTVDSLHGKNNKKPKKGVKHWFDALDDDEEDDDKIYTQDSSPSVMTTVVQVTEESHAEHNKEENSPQIKTTMFQVGEKPRTEPNNVPGTPAWAVTKFASPEIRREDFKFGAFGSHPSELPPGSPPLAESAMPNPFEVVQGQNSPSQSPSVATITDEGPEVVATIINRPFTGLRPASDSVAWRRKSTIAPEVISVEKSSKRPARSLQFVAEMEGSAPFGSIAHEMPSAMVMELEASEQHFKLPPRPSTPHCSPSIIMESSSEDPAQPSEQQQEVYENQTSLQPESSQPCSSLTDVAEVVEVVELAVKSTDNHMQAENSEVNDIVDETIDASEIVQTQLLLPAKTYMPTPQISLPPSPPDTQELLPSIAEDQSQENKVDPALMFLLPAVAYRAPSSEEQTLSKLSPGHTATSTKQLELRSSMQEMLTIPPILGEVTAQPSLCAEMPVPGVTPTATTFTEFVARGPPPEESTRHARSRSSHGSHNGWKAFFTGQPSPAGSSLSIKSIRRESADDMYGIDQRSPVLQSSASGGNRVALPERNIVRNVGYLSHTFDDEKETVQDVYGEQDKTTAIGLGLGIHAITVQQD